MTTANAVHPPFDGRKGSSSPIILCGSERSGTTLLRLMLDNHPELAFQQEFEVAVEKMPESGGWPDMAEYHDYLRTYRFVSFFYDIDPSLDYPTLIKTMIEQKRTRDHKRLLGATVHLHFDRVLRLWPDACFIKLLRDGRDVARSNIGMGWAGNVYFGVERWITAEHLWTHVKSMIPQDRWIEVRYEDLVADPVGQLTRICQWMGIEFSPKMLEYMHTEMGKNYKYPDPKLSYQWKKKLSEREVQLVESRIAEMLVERGYELSGHARLAPSTKDIAVLKAQNRYALARYRYDKFGPRLWLESIVARRSGIKRWADQVELKMNEIVNESLD